MAEFNWYLNRQGPRGKQGVQGEQGFSPVITVETDSLNAYILRIRTQNDTFLTPNLRGSVEDLGGTYVRYNRDTGVMYAGSADLADTTNAGIIRIAAEQDLTELSQDAAVTPKQLMENIQSAKNELQANIDSNTTLIDTYYKELTDSDTAIKANVTKINEAIDQLDVKDSQNVKITGNQTIGGTKTFTGDNTFAGETTFNGHTLITEQEAVSLNVTSIATMKNVNVSGTLTSNGEINAVAINAAGIKNNQNNKYYLNQGSITAGDNVTIEETTDGVKISSIASGNVSAAGDNNFTGINTFNGEIRVVTDGRTQHGLVFPPVNRINKGAFIRQRRDHNGLEIYEYNEDGTVGPRIGYLTSSVVVFEGKVAGSQGYLFGDNNLVAGDNITFETANGVTTISSTASGGGGAEIDDENISTTTVYSSDKTVSFTTNLISETMATLNEAINQLTTKVNDLTARVKALEDLVDGGNA